MSKVLITGMTSSHTAQSANKRALSFAGVVQCVLDGLGHDVTMGDPNINYTAADLSNYDSIIVGVAPITSLSANKAYGALNLIDVALSTNKLTILLDAPQPTQVVSSLRAIESRPENLTKDFYKSRKAYREACIPDVQARLLSTVSTLLYDEWPTTIYPALPWETPNAFNKLPGNITKSFQGINLDSHLITEKKPSATQSHLAQWAADSPYSVWTRRTGATILNDIVPMRKNKGTTDDQADEVMLSSIGSLISPHRDGTWWTYRYAQSMSNLTPVATEWRDSRVLGNSWSLLASSIEQMSVEDRAKLANEQRSSYLSAINDKKTSAHMLASVVLREEVR